MTRSIPLKGPRVWRLFCDELDCRTVSTESWPAPPELEEVRDLGWSVGKKSDSCPECVAAGRLPKEPYDFEAAARRRAELGMKEPPRG